MSSTLKGKKTSKSFTHFSTTRPHIEQLLVPLKKNKPNIRGVPLRHKVKVSLVKLQ